MNATELNLFSAKHSPRKLNEMGEKLFTAIDGAKFLEENKETLFQSIKDRKPLAALDVEQYAYLACRDLIDTPEFTRFKDFVYEEPAWDMGNGIKHDITLNNVCFVLGLALRDMYLEEVGV